MKNINWDNIYWWIRYGIWTWITDRPQKIKWFFQRGFRGYADCDVWDFDDYLTDVISNGLKHLKENQHGIPTSIWTKYIKLDDLKTADRETKEIAADKEWKIILNQIIEGFDAARVLIDYSCELDEKERKEIEQIRQRGFDLFKEYFFNLWD